MKKNYYTVDHTRKTLTVDDRYQMSWRDQIDLDFYAKAGYRIHHKNARKSRFNIEKADRTRKRDILAVMKTDPVALEEFEKIQKENGFFAAKKYYRDWLKAHNVVIVPESVRV